MPHSPLPAPTRRAVLLASASALAFPFVRTARAADETPWPPPLTGATNGTVTFTSPALLDVPEVVRAYAKDATAAPFVVAKTPPTVDLAFHRDLGPGAATRRLWSSWGDIALARDGSVYCGVGDHGDDAGGDARCFVYRWTPAGKTLAQVVDMNKVVPPKPGQPAWSKIHAKIDEGADGRIYFSCTLNDGNRARNTPEVAAKAAAAAPPNAKKKSAGPTYAWTPELPGGQLYAFDPKTNQTSVVATLPTGPRCTATSLYDAARNLWWCNLEAGSGDALCAIDLATGKPVYQSPDGTVKFNRNFALAADGSVYFNGDAGSLWKRDAKTGNVVQTKSTFSDSPGMRASTRESKDGAIYGVTHKTGQIFRYRPAADDLKLLGPAWHKGEYVTVCELSPDERFLYYLPGAHGGAFKYGTPVIQYDLAEGTRKVLAFLAPALEKAHGYVPAGTYGMKVSGDGATLYVNFNGHPAEATRPQKMKPNGFGLTAFAAIHIPASER